MERGSSLQAAARLSDSKAKVAAIRERARQAHIANTPAWEVATQLADETETVIVEFFRDMLEGLSPADRRLVEQNTSVVKMGGFGRGEMAPYSDVDLLFLYRGTIDTMLTDALGSVVRNCWDAGIKLGHSVQNLRDAVRLARTDITFATSAIEARLLCGDAQLLNDFRQLFRRKVVDRNLQAFTESCIETRNIERKKFGGTVSQVQPNIKRSPGGLRDLHLMRWIGFARYQVSQVDDLDKVWALAEEDVRLLVEARDFMTRIRCELHFQAGGPQDVLTREEQLRLADTLGYEGRPGLKPVECFMRDYFRYASAIDDLAERLASMDRPRAISARIAERFLPNRTEDIFILSGDQIDVQTDHHARLCGDLSLQVSLFALSARTGIDPSPTLLRDIAESHPDDPDEISPETAEEFLSILTCTGAIESTLRKMYKAGVLEAIIPEMSRARGLLEFNEYHKYTVDEHSLIAVGAVEAFHEEPSLLGQVYGEVKRKHLLHLAMLLHDMGKGFEEDHCLVGGQIAAAVAERLHLKESHGDRLVFLVEKHLVMSHLAFRRNINDINEILPFTRDVGSLDMLRMLYVLTAADITAVGPGTWNEWKGSLLAELYERSMLLLSGIRHDVEFNERLNQLRQRVRQYVSGSAVLSATLPGDQWVSTTMDTLPDHFLSSNNVEQVVDDLKQIAALQPNDSLIDWSADPINGTVLYRIVTHDSLAQGCFSKMAGVMAAMGLEIVSAEICTTSDGIVVDKFRVVDPEHPKGTPQVRLGEIKRIIHQVLAGERTVKSLFQTRRSKSASRLVGPAPSPRIVFDNNSSETCTIIDVFARNRLGLLYAITGALFDLGLSVQLAKISTYGEKAVDVFYVTCENGKQLTDADQLRYFAEELRKRVEDI